MVGGARVDTFLALGSNLGDRAATIEGAIEFLARAGEVAGKSPLYETAPVGITDQPAFINAVIRLRTSLGPERLFVYAKSVEAAFGRRPGVRYGPRPLDIDLLIYGDLHIHTTRLDVPHPHLAERAFVLIPLRDIAPEVVLPGPGATVRELAARVDGRSVTPWESARAAIA